MVLQRVTGEARQEDDASLDAYVLRITPGGQPVCYRERAPFEQIQHWASYLKAVGRMHRPVATIEEEDGGCFVLRVSAVRRGGSGPDLIEL
jgi:hypothetical protein